MHNNTQATSIQQKNNNERMIEEGNESKTYHFDAVRIERPYHIYEKVGPNMRVNRIAFKYMPTKSTKITDEDLLTCLRCDKSVSGRPFTVDTYVGTDASPISTTICEECDRTPATKRKRGFEEYVECPGSTCHNYIRHYNILYCSQCGHVKELPKREED